MTKLRTSKDFSAPTAEKLRTTIVAKLATFKSANFEVPTAKLNVSRLPSHIRARATGSKFKINSAELRLHIQGATDFKELKKLEQLVFRELPHEVLPKVTFVHLKKD
ncbi:MAG: hypothetical protein WC861_06575 [Candidatus Micrarchaeia archaeon]|jgi:hypothetical protein